MSIQKGAGWTQRRCRRLIRRHCLIGCHHRARCFRRCSAGTSRRVHARRYADLCLLPVRRMRHRNNYHVVMMVRGAGATAPLCARGGDRGDVRGLWGVSLRPGARKALVDWSVPRRAAHRRRACRGGAVSRRRQSKQDEHSDSGRDRQDSGLRARRHPFVAFSTARTLGMSICRPATMTSPAMGAVTSMRFPAA